MDQSIMKCRIGHVSHFIKEIYYRKILNFKFENQGLISYQKVSIKISIEF